MKKWLIVILLGVLFIGVGAGITILEVSNYTFAEYPAAQGATETASISLLPGYPVTLNNNNYPNAIEVVIDPTLGDQAKIEYPAFDGLVKLQLSNSGNNHLYINTETNPFRVVNTLLAGLRQDVVYHFTPSDVTIKLYLNETYAKALAKASTQRNQSTQQIEELESRFQEELDQQAQSYQQQIEALENQINMMYE